MHDWNFHKTNEKPTHANQYIVRLCAYKKNENSHKVWFDVYRYVWAYYAGEIVNAYKFSKLTQTYVTKSLSRNCMSFTVALVRLYGLGTSHAMLCSSKTALRFMAHNNRQCVSRYLTNIQDDMQRRHRLYSIKIITSQLYKISF